MAQHVIAVYPGTFDPMTLGHEDVVRRATQLFDRVIVAVAAGHHKKAMFTLQERIEMAREVVKEYPQVEVESFSGLLVEFMEQIRAHTIVRGLRAVSDFEYEFQMALMNRHLNPRIETVFMMPKEEYSYVSSRLLKEVSKFGAEITGLLPPTVFDRLRQKQGSGPLIHHSRGPGPEEAL